MQAKRKAVDSRMCLPTPGGGLRALLFVVLRALYCCSHGVFGGVDIVGSFLHGPLI